MKKTGWITSTMLGSCIAVGLLAGGVSEKANHTTPALVITTISLGKLNQAFSQPNLFDQSMVWVGDAPRTPLHTPDTLFYMNLGNRKPSALAKTTYAGGFLAVPEIDARWIAWIDYGYQNHAPWIRIFVMNRATGKTLQVASFKGVIGSSFFMEWISLDGNELIWSQPLKLNGLVLKSEDLQSSKTTIIRTIHSTLAPAIYQFKNTLVWEESTTRSGLIEVLNMQNGIQKTMPVSGRFSYPEIYSNYLLYSPEEFRKIPGGLFNQRLSLTVMDLRSGRMFSISAHDAYFWSLGQGFVTWSDYSLGSSTVFVEMISSHKRILLAKNGFLPYAFGNRIVWSRQSTRMVYLTTVTTDNVAAHVK
ncbi:MAG: hypothetical protein ACYCYO_16840 [Bacilli bacterium]